VALDPDVRTFLDLLAAAGGPKLWQLTPAEARQTQLALAAVADVKDVPIGRIDDGELPGAGGPLRFRSYTPTDPAHEPWPCLVYFHGGGFIMGDLDTHDGVCRMLANASGCRVLSVAYRLAPEHRFPAAVEDTFAATTWVAEHARALGLDPDRLAVGGDSAGGNLAAVTCQLAKQAGGPRIALQILICPMTDDTTETASRRAFAEGYFLEDRIMRHFQELYYTAAADREDPRASPLRAADLRDLPPAHVHTAEFDPLRDEAKAYADRLVRAGVPVEYTCHPGMIHHFYAVAGAIPYGRSAMREAGAAIKAALR
jgi:acetyl esterase/lipase